MRTEEALRAQSDPRYADDAFAGVRAWPPQQRFVVRFLATGTDDDAAFGWDGAGWYWSWLGDGCDTPDADLFGPFGSSRAAYRDGCMSVLEQLHEDEAFR